MENADDKTMNDKIGGCCCGFRRRHGFRMAGAGLLFLAATVYLAILAYNAWKSGAFIGRPQPQRDTINVSGEGKVTALPDIATLTVGVQTEKKTVGDAQKENTAKMNAIVSKVKELGAADKDVQTTSYTIYPAYDYVDGKQVLRGYDVNQVVTLKVRNLDSIGQILQAVGDLGANQVGGVNFTIDDPESVRQQARLKALDAAKSKARDLAKAAGIRLGDLVSFTESYSPSPTPFPLYAESKAYGLGGGAAPSIERGSQDVIVDVSVIYEVLH